MPPALILADDATGALECASLLAPFLPASFEIHDTQTRHLPPAEAAARIRQLAAPGHPLYKKTDSALRGNISAELLALLPRTIVYIPAYPNLGRTVVKGQLLLHGIPIHQTDFAHDPHHPISSSQLADLFPQSIAIPHPSALAAHLHQPAILICDATTNDHLAGLASVLSDATPLPVIAGPSGFLPHWARLLHLPPAPHLTLPKASDWLIVCGSRHPQSRRQAQHARQLGLPVLETPADHHLNPTPQLAQQAAQYIQTFRPQAVLIMGGDTVFALWQLLGVADIVALPELLPGIAASWSPSLQTLFVTKAGGFGNDILVEELIQRT